MIALVVLTPHVCMDSFGDCVEMLKMIYTGMLLLHQHPETGAQYSSDGGMQQLCLDRCSRCLAEESFITCVQTSGLYAR